MTVDGKERGFTPLTIADLTVGSHRVVIESRAGSVRRDVIIPADAEATLNEVIISGWIAVFAPIELQIYERTRRLGTTEDARIMVPPGHHELTLINTEHGYKETRGIDVNPGETTALNITTIPGYVIGP